MNFVEGKDEFKRVGTCVVWFLITFGFGFLVSFILYRTKFDDFWYIVALAAGGCSYILALIINCSIKSIKAGPFEVTSSKADNSPDKAYKALYYGFGPYTANRLGINYPGDLHSSKEYHLCEIKFYEIIAKRRAWNIFCPFIETEALTVEETDDIINSVILNK